MDFGTERFMKAFLDEFESAKKEVKDWNLQLQEDASKISTLAFPRAAVTRPFERSPDGDIES